VSSDNRDRDRDRGEWQESVVAIRRCAAVVKGGNVPMDVLAKNVDEYIASSRG